MGVNTTFTLEDAYSRTGAKKVEGTATTIAQADTDAGLFLTAWDLVSGCGVIAQTHNVQTAVSQAPQAGANIDAGATIHCRLNNGKLYPLKVPGILPSLINSDGSVKIDDDAITDFVGLFMQAGPFRVSDGNHVVSIAYGELDR